MAAGEGGKAAGVVGALVSVAVYGLQQEEVQVLITQRTFSVEHNVASLSEGSRASVLACTIRDWQEAGGDGQLARLKLLGYVAVPQVNSECRTRTCERTQAQF